MDRLQVSEWNFIEGSVTQRRATLADDNLEFSEGKQDELDGRIQKIAGETLESFEETIGELRSDLGSKAE